MGDRGGNERIGQQLWQALSRELAGKIREDLTFQGLCTVIEWLGVVLGEHFPRAADDTNELPNEVME